MNNKNFDRLIHFINTFQKISKVCLIDHHKRLIFVKRNINIFNTIL